MTWKNNEPKAPWLTNCYTPRTCRQLTCRLFDLPGVSPCVIALDYMHCKYLGSLQLIYGSVLYLLCHVLMPDEAEENLRKIAAFIKDFQKSEQTTVRYSQLFKFSQFQRGKEYPKMRGKAGELRHVGNAILALWRAYMVERREIHREILHLLEIDLEIDVILDRFHPQDGYYAVPAKHAKKIKELALQSVSLHTHLEEHFTAEGLKIFNITSKSHMMAHALVLSKDIHPYLVWCFTGEDFMRSMSKLLLSSVRGVQPAAGLAKGSAKMRAAMHFNFEQHRY